MIDKKELFQLYWTADWKTKLYLKIKLMICPFLTLESFVPARGRIVDLGCGNGLFDFILKLGSPLREIIGLDYDETKLKLAQKIQRQSNLCEFQKADLSQLNFPPGDVYLLIDVLYLLPYSTQLEVLKKCYELLPPGGYIFIKEIDNHPKWKYLWNYFQETLAVKLIGFTRGKKFYFRSSADWASILQKLGCLTSVVRLDKGYCHAHVLITGQK
ncbi:MAG: methyltransferase domain-containing protein [Candidatus Aminicenantes bacterium]|nr:methyltransferase domain-containing protein [Candidatus Aminicenantes bacterium]